MDLYLFHLVNQFAFKWAWLDVLGKFCAQYLGYVLIVFLLLFLVLKYRRYWRMVFQAIAAAILARLVITEIIRWVFPRNRPFLTVDKANVLLSNIDHIHHSFPSGHAAFFFAISVVVFLYARKAYLTKRESFLYGAGILFLVFSSLICLGRVFVGVHWPSDVLAGALVGIFSGWLVFYISEKFIK